MSQDQLEDGGPNEGSNTPVTDIAQDADSLGAIAAASVEHQVDLAADAAYRPPTSKRLAALFLLLLVVGLSLACACLAVVTLLSWAGGAPAVEGQVGNGAINVHGWGLSAGGCVVAFVSASILNRKRLQMLRRPKPAL